jgi:predicted Zn-dependent protease with MMP-like domain
MARFEDHVERALESLPPALANRLQNVAVVVVDEDPDDPDLYGLFDEPEFLPARIVIYRRPLEEDYGRDLRELERQIRITVLHEVAHYFGLDEGRLSELGYE